MSRQFLNGINLLNQLVTAIGVQMNTNKLLGRSTASAGAIEEITIGSGLSLTSGTLSATGGGGASAITISAKTGAYTVVAGDLGTIINCTSGTFTVSLTAAATLGSGFNCWIWNTSTTAAHAITIDPSGAETIDGVATLILRRGEGTQIVCNGTNWETGDKKVMRGYAENFVSDGTRPIASGDDSTAIGKQASATGRGSLAISANRFAGATASGVGSIAIGDQASASATFSIAMGRTVIASATNSVAIGLNSGNTGSQAVTGSGAMALGGSYASGTDSFAAAIADNTSSYGATGANSLALGKQAKATQIGAIAIGELSTSSGAGGYSIAVGYTSNASGPGAIAIGNNYFIGAATASGGSSIAFGDSARATQDFSTALGAASNSVIIGKYAYAGGRFSTNGDAQAGTCVLRSDTTDATPEALTTNNSAASTNNQITLPNNSAYAFHGTIVARQQASGGTASAAWKIEGLIRREGTAASTTLVASTVTAISNVPGWTLALSADTTNGGLKIEATGAAATNIRWVATINTSEVTY